MRYILRIRVTYSACEVSNTHTRFVGMQHTPDFGLARDRCHLCHWLSAQRIDDTRLSDIGIADKTNTNLLPVLVEDAELPEEVDKRATAKGILHARPHSTCRVIFLKNSDPGSL